jgi:peroxiredoxin
MRSCLFALVLLPLAALPLPAQGAFESIPAPAWQLTDVAGHAVSSEQFKGKVVVLDFWATWCAPCRGEIPGYIKLQKKYQKAGLAIVGVSVDQDGPAVVRQFMADHGFDYPVVMGDQKIVDAYGGVDAIPTTFIIDRHGVIRYRKVGAMPEEQFAAVLEKILRQP